MDFTSLPLTMRTTKSLRASTANLNATITDSSWSSMNKDHMISTYPHPGDFIKVPANSWNNQDSRHNSRIRLSGLEARQMGKCTYSTCAYRNMYAVFVRFRIWCPLYLDMVPIVSDMVPIVTLHKTDLLDPTKADLIKSKNGLSKTRKRTLESQRKLNKIGERRLHKIIIGQNVRDIRKKTKINKARRI